MDQKWTKVEPRARSGTTYEKCLEKMGLQCHFGLHFGGHFLTKNETENGANIRCVLDGVLVAFWPIWGSILGSILALFQLWRAKSDDRVKMRK